MKKLIIVSMLIAALLLTACGAPTAAPATTAPSTTIATAKPTVAPTPVPTATVEPTATPATGKQEGQGTLGNFAVKITGSSIMKDYDGKDAIVITTEWTNNSDKTTSYMSSMYTKAFQSGVQMETAMIINDTYKADASTKDVRPGTTITVMDAYVLDGTNAQVEFEITEFLGMDANVMVYKNFAVK